MNGAADDARHRRGALWIIGATIVGGGSGYVVTIVAGAALGAVDYEPFAVYWSTLYLIVAAVSGLQQEFARASSPRVATAGRGTVAGSPGRSAVAAVVGIPLILGGIIAVTSLWWGPVLLGENGVLLSLPLAAAVSGYCVTAILSGILSGIGAWSAVAAMTVVDGLLRLLLTVAALATGSVELAAWAVATPFVVVPIAALIVGLRRFRGRVSWESGIGRILRNSVATVLGAIAIGAIVSGLPSLLVATTVEAEPGSLAGLLYAINLTRAPIIIAVLALQSYLIVHFRRSDRAARDLSIASAAILIGGAVLAAAGWAGAPALVGFLGGGDFTLSSPEAAVVVASGAVVALLTLTGAAVLAANAHAAYASGWVTAAFATIIALVGMPDGVARLVVALVVAPLVGVAVHAVALSSSRVPRRGQESELLVD